MRRGRAAVTVLAVVPLLLLARGPLGGSVPQLSPPSRIPDRYDFSIERLRRWLVAVHGHDPGTMDEPTRAVREWSLADLIGAPRDFERLRAIVQQRGLSAGAPGCKITVGELLQSVGVTAAQVTGDEILERAVVLHTDISIDVHTQVSRQDEVAMVPAVGVWHFQTAWTCAQMLERAARRHPFVRQWYVSFAAFLAAGHELRNLPRFIELALAAFPSDRDLLMISGCVQEYLACPRVQEGADLPEPIPGNETAHLKQAEKAFRLAMGPGTPPPELSMRFGRVLGLLGRHDEALAVLKPALGVPADARFSYFLNLFIGDEEAALGHDDLAQQAYRHAQAILPSDQAAYLAASRLAHRAGDKPGAAAVVQRMLAPDSERVHPWKEYYEAGRQAQADQFLSDLRAPFRKAKTPRDDTGGLREPFRKAGTR